MATLRLILGDQLSHDIASLRDLDAARDTVVMAEVDAEATYVKHHKKKIAYLFSAMRHFAAELEEKQVKIAYTKIDDRDNAGSLEAEIKRRLSETEYDKLVVVEPGEFRLLKTMQGWEHRLGIRTEIRRDDRFITTTDQFNAWADGRKRLTMEYFYRELRKDTGILMDDGEPAGGKWNFDHDNREKLPSDVTLPERLRIEPDETTQAVLDTVADTFSDHFGELEDFWFAVTAKEAEKQLDWFIDEALCDFGDYQDAMKEGEAFLFHSVLSLYMNAGLLDPLKVCRKAEKAYRDGKAPINAVEGFIRQILGWREFVRGIYWRYMPDYRNRNFLGATRKLPEFYWTGETRMACLRDAVLTTRRHAYAHHIQRLMLTGNFALIAGIDPEAVNEWYLIVYADAYEWVEAPNTHGMALFADGGIMATKPYAASGSYINKMSDHCKGCSYAVSKKNGDKACPFNYLYWNFLMENEDKLRGNHRLGMIYKTLDRMSDEKKTAVAEDSRRFFKEIGI